MALIDVILKGVPHQPRNRKWIGAGGTSSSSVSVNTIGGPVDLSDIYNQIADLSNRINTLQTQIGTMYIRKDISDVATGPLTVNSIVTSPEFQSDFYKDGEGYHFDRERLRICHTTHDSAHNVPYDVFNPVTKSEAVSEGDTFYVALSADFDYTTGSSGLWRFSLSVTPHTTGIDIDDCEGVVVSSDGMTVLNPRKVSGSGILTTWEVSLPFADIWTVQVTATVYNGSDRTQTMNGVLTGADYVYESDEGSDQHSDVTATSVEVYDGDTGMRITATGLQRTTDGGETWTNV